jgi:thiamine-phosphate pyrophosphorylase
VEKMSRLYPIVDADVLRRHGLSVGGFARELRAAGIKLLQYRDKAGDPQDILHAASLIREEFSGTDCRLIMNDRADLAVLAGWGGVHVGQSDQNPEDARKTVGPKRWVGVSTHTDEQVLAADSSCADYIAVGPVFTTSTKADAEATVGLDGVRRARKLTKKPIVAIGGITRANAREVIDAGADSVAMISGLVDSEVRTERLVRELLDEIG